MSDADDARVLGDLADLWAKATPLGYPHITPGAYNVIANNTISAGVSYSPGGPSGQLGKGRKVIQPPYAGWEAYCRTRGQWHKSSLVEGSELVDIFATQGASYRALVLDWWQLYCATTNEWASWDEQAGAWVECPPPGDAQVTLPPAIPQEPEAMLLDGVLTELWDSTVGKVDQGRTVRLLARYRALTGKERPEFMRGH